MERASLGLRHRFPMRAAVVGTSVVAAVLGSIAFAAAAPGDVTTTPSPTPSPTVPRTSTPQPQVATPTTPTTTVEPPSYEGRLPLCPLANSWGPSGVGIAATVFEYGPATVTVDVEAATGNQSKSVVLNVGDNSATIAFDILPGVVRSVSVRAVGPGPLPSQCLLARAD